NDTGGGTSNDDHPHADIRAGDAFLAEIFKTLSTGPLWENTALVINYDERGGFYDHVAPPRAAASSPLDNDVVGGKAPPRFRAPPVPEPGSPLNPVPGIGGQLPIAARDNSWEDLMASGLLKGWNLPKR